MKLYGPRAVLAYKNFAANKNISHIGLGVAAMNTAKTLNARRNNVEVLPIVNSKALRARLNDGITHVVVSAPWIPSSEWQSIIADFPDVKFAVNCHSNVGFLQADTNGMKLVREAMEIERGSSNFHLAGNSAKFCRWIHRAFHAPCAYLPNLYHMDAHMPQSANAFHGGTLRIGAFGATRVLKNFMSAAGAALEIASTLRVPVELWVSSGREEGGAGMLSSVRAMFDGLPHVKLVEAGWQSWPKFRETIRHMHLLLQPSYTESFNMVTADGIAEGVPSVVSDAIDWAPEHWKAAADDVCEIARVGRMLLTDPNAVHEGRMALANHNANGHNAWQAFLAD